MSDPERYEDFYQALRGRISDWLESKGKRFKHAQILLLAPDLFHLLARLVLDRRIPTAEKATLGSPIFCHPSICCRRPCSGRRVMWMTWRSPPSC
jgi:hypothetical protein